MPSVLAKRLICRGGTVDFSSMRTLDIIVHPNCCGRQRAVFVQGFRLDGERRELCARGRIVPIEPQVFDLLVYLIQNRDRVVSKNDLIASVWGGRIVSDSTLDSRINAVRKAIGDSGEQQALVRTIPRKGIRFVGEVLQGTRVVGGNSPLIRSRSQTRNFVLSVLRQHQHCICRGWKWPSPYQGRQLAHTS